MNRLYQLAEWFGLCGFIAEREGQYTQWGESCPTLLQKYV